jgi:hypothetical protein
MSSEDINDLFSYICKKIIKKKEIDVRKSIFKRGDRANYNTINISMADLLSLVRRYQIQSEIKLTLYYEPEQKSWRDIDEEPEPANVHSVMEEQKKEIIPELQPEIKKEIPVTNIKPDELPDPDFLD